MKDQSLYADEPWFRLTRRLFRSSVWEEDPPTRVVWITLLHLAQLPENRKHGAGTVLITRGNLAREAFVTAEQLEHAIGRLSAPDPSSRTAEAEGRRLEVLQNGYRIRNFELYHDADEFARWRSQRVAAGKARAEKAPRSKGRFASGGPATAGAETSDRWSATSKTRRDENDNEVERETNVTERDPVTFEALTGELLAVCNRIAQAKQTSVTAIVRRVSAIPASNGLPAKPGFDDPRGKGISEAWIRGSLGRARELLSETERPVPL